MQGRFCRWETWGGVPYFANLKVMRLVLSALREALTGSEGALRAYVFLEDRLIFFAQGSPATLPGALERARVAAEVGFRCSDNKPLWGASHDEIAGEPDLERLLGLLRRVPVEAGLASDISDYPWAGGDWLIPGG